MMTERWQYEDREDKLQQQRQCRMMREKTNQNGNRDYESE